MAATGSGLSPEILNRNYTLTGAELEQLLTCARLDEVGFKTINLLLDHHDKQNRRQANYRTLYWWHGCESTEYVPPCDEQNERVLTFTGVTRRDVHLPPEIRYECTIHHLVILAECLRDAMKIHETLIDNRVTVEHLEYYIFHDQHVDGLKNSILHDWDPHMLGINIIFEDNVQKAVERHINIDKRIDARNRGVPEFDWTKAKRRRSVSYDSSPSPKRPRNRSPASY